MAAPTLGPYGSQLPVKFSKESLQYPMEYTK